MFLIVSNFKFVHESKIDGFSYSQSVVVENVYKCVFKLIMSYDSKRLLKSLFKGISKASNRSFKGLVKLFEGGLKIL